MLQSHKMLRHEGHPGYRICEVAEKEHVNLVVMGTRGMGSVRRTVLGSVSDHVLHHLHVPVAICHLRDIPAAEDESTKL